MKKLREDSAFVSGVLMSIALLVTFICLSKFAPSLLDLDTQWLIVSGIPILAVLIAGGYIKKFKGFGMEIEAGLAIPVTSIGLKATDALSEIEGSLKESKNKLHTMSSDRISKIRRLTFIQGKKCYYDVDAILEYLKILTSLEYFEIQKSSGRFVCLIPVNEFRFTSNSYSANGNNGGEFNRRRIRDFVDAVGEKRVKQEFKDELIEFTIKQDEGLLDVLKRLTNKGVEVGAVTSANGSLVGIINLRDVERQIANTVLRAGHT